MIYIICTWHKVSSYTRHLHLQSLALYTMHSTVAEYERCSFSRWLGPKSAILSSTRHFIHFSSPHWMLRCMRWEINIRCYNCKWCISQNSILAALLQLSLKTLALAPKTERSCWWGSGKHFGCLRAGLLSTKYGHLPPGKIIIWPFRYAIMDQNYAAARRNTVIIIIISGR